MHICYESGRISVYDVYVMSIDQSGLISNSSGLTKGSTFSRDGLNLLQLIIKIFFQGKEIS